MTGQFELLYYQTQGGRVPYWEWLESVRDSTARSSILSRTDRLRRGLLGDCEPVGDGVWELRIDVGRGYRAYYARAGKQIVLILCGGDKRRQSADINRAREFWRDYEQRLRATRSTR